MPYCLNPRCPKPPNPDGTNFCQSCGSRLRLGDRYTAYQPMGQGQSSRTFLGMDTRQWPDSRCVIKQFPMGKEADAFRQETARLSELSQHPQLPKILAYFERDQGQGQGQDQWQYLVQEFVEGRSLTQQRQAEGTFDEAQIRAILQSVLPVLQYLHEHSVIHRDVKPRNLIRRTDSPTAPLILVDLGAAKFVSTSTLGKTGTLIGSAEYAAPEQLMGKATFASDLYSLAASCLELITGLSPFDLFDATVGQWFWRSIATDISPDLAEILDKMLAGNVGDRFPSAADALRALGSSPTQILLAQSWKPVAWSAIWQDQGTEVWVARETLSLGQGIRAIAPHPTQPLLVTAHSDGRLRQWALPLTDDPTSQQCFEGHLHGVTCATFSSVPSPVPDQSDYVLISGGQDHTLRLWDLASDRLRQTLSGHRGPVTAIAPAPHEDLLISGSHDKTLRLWQLSEGRPLATLSGHTHPVAAIAYDPATRLLISGDTGGFVKIWHVGTRELLRTLSGHGAQVSAVALLPTHDLALSSSWDMTLKLRNLNTGGLRHNLTGHLLPITALALQATDLEAQSPPLFASSSHDGLVKLWNPLTGELRSILRGHGSPVEAIAFCPTTHRLWSGCRDGTLTAWAPVTP